MDPASELLNQLKELSLPVEYGWGIAPGWWGVMALLCLLVFWLIRRWLRRPSPPPDWRPVAREELARLQNLSAEVPAPMFMAECSRLSRRIALASLPRSQVAALHGEAWLQQLDELSNSHLFTTGAGRLLLSGPYQRGTDTSPVLVDDAGHPYSQVELLGAVETLLHQCSARAA